MKKVLCLILAMVMLLGILPAYATENEAVSAGGSAGGAAGVGGGAAAGGGGGTAVEDGYEISGSITLGEDAILENGMLMGWICAYGYTGEYLDMAELGEGEFSFFFEGETDSFDYQLTVPKDVGELVLAVRTRTEATGDGAFQSNILSDYVYYGGAASTLDYTEALVVPVTGDCSGVDIQLSTGAGLSWQGKFPAEATNYSEYTTISVEDKGTGKILAQTNTYIDRWESWENLVLSKEYLGREVYLSYDLYYTDDVLYTEPLYINPDGSLAKTREEAVAHTLTGANSVSFTTGLKVDFTTGIKGTISFEEGCTIGGFTCTIVAENTVSEDREYVYLYEQGIGEYSYVLAVPEGTYRVWAEISPYDQSSNVSECDYYYTENGMVYNRDDAEIIDSSVKNTGIDFEFKKTKTLKGKIEIDGEFLHSEDFRPQFHISSAGDSYWTEITIQEDLTFQVDVPVSMEGNCSAYLYVEAGSSIIPDYYYYKNEETGDQFNADGEEPILFRLTTGDLIRGKLKLPDGVNTTGQERYQISLATMNSYGNVYTKQSVWTTIKSGETEAEILFAVPKGDETDYILYSRYEGYNTHLYDDIAYYTGTEKSSIYPNLAKKVTGGTGDIVFPVLKGITIPVTITNPEGGEYLEGSYALDFGDFSKKRYFYLSAGQKQESSFVLAEEQLGQDAYLSYSLDRYNNVSIFINPDGSLTNNKKAAVPHRITQDTSLGITLSAEESLFAIPTIKGRLRIPETAYITDGNGTDTTISGNLYLYRDGNQVFWKDISGGVGDVIDFTFEPYEIGEYTLGLYLDNWYRETNLICNKTLYYTGTGWSENQEEAKVLENTTQQEVEADMPALPVLTGRVAFSEGTYLEDEIRYEITYTDVESGEETVKAGYIDQAEEFSYQVNGIAGAKSYYVAVRFGSHYSQDYNTNIPYGTTYYYTEKGLTPEETAVRKAVAEGDEVTLKMPVKPSVKGMVTFPEGAEFTETGRVFITLYDENGYRSKYREYYVETTEDFPFAIAADEDGAYGVTVSFDTYDGETNLDEGTLYYTKGGMTGDVDQRTTYPLEELSEIQLELRQKRYVTGRLIAEDFVKYDDTLSARAVVQGETRGFYGGIEFDDQLGYKLEIPTEIEGEFTIGFSFDEKGKNNIVKEEWYYHTDASGETQRFSYPNCTDINVAVETGYIFSGEVKLPQDAVVYEGQELGGSVSFGSGFWSEYTIPYGERAGEFFMVIPKTGYTGTLFTSNGYRNEGKSENLYLGQVYYKDDNTSVVDSKNAVKIRVDKEKRDGVIMLVTGEVYRVAFSKPQEITNDEEINLLAEIGTNRIEASVSFGGEAEEAAASVVIPPDYNGQRMYLYYDLAYDESNELYREKVYITPEGDLSGSKKLAEPFEIGKGSQTIPVQLATEEDISFPDYIYRSPYPYKDNGENRFSYEYTEGDCDYLKVTFAEETYFAYGSYYNQDAFYITYGDGASMGPYYTDDLAGKTLNIPGNSFEAYISGQADTNAFGFAIESIEPKKFSLETEHPYISSTAKEYPYTHSGPAEGLRLHFSEDTDFSGSMEIRYTQDGMEKTITKRDYNLAGGSVDIRGNSFTITMPKDTTGSYYGFTIVEIEELEYVDITFLNYDGTELYRTEVEKGKNVSYYGNTPTRERDEDYIYTFEGWDKSLTNIQEDTVFTAEFAENPYATVWFKNSVEDETPLYTDYVILGEAASFEGAVLPSKPISGTTAYVFTGWSGSLSNIRKDTLLTAEFEECGILLQSAHPYGEEELKTYTYEGSADSITLYFSSDSMIAPGDELVIYDEQDRAQHYLTGYLGNMGYTIPGKTAKLQIIGSEGGEFGYALAKAVPMWHRFTEWDSYVEPTCVEEGVEYRWCRNCYEEEERTVPPLGHSFGVWQEDTDGTVYKECSRCQSREIFEGDTGNLGVVNITVVDGVTMKPIPDATITAYDENNNESIWYTDEAGVASQLLNQGVNNLVIFAEDYGMRNISISVKGGVTNLPVVGLTKRPPLECELVAKIMDMEEIKAAGIDVTDPLNSQVYKYRIDIGFGESIIYFNKEGHYIERGGDRLVFRNENGETATIHPVNNTYFLVIYGQAKWLKEMFDVELVAVNTSATDRIENLVAELDIPAGMSLAAMNTLPQSDVQNLGSLASGEKKSVHWYVRGDEAGEYFLSAKLTGTMMPFGEQFGYEYTTKEPVKVYAGEALKMNIVVPSAAVYGEDYTVRIEIENVSDRSVYNLSNSIDKVLETKFLTIGQDGYEKYFEENALGYVAVDELKPGEKIVAELKANILFQSNVIKDKISTLADRLREETDVLAIFNGFKAALDLMNDNYDVLDKASGNVQRGKEFLTGEELEAAEELEQILEECKDLVKSGSSSRAMYFINRLKQENTLEELTTLSKDANFYTVWTEARIGQLSAELDALKREAQNPENCGDYDIYEDVKKIVKAVPVTFWFKDLFVSTLEGSTTEITYSVQLLPTDRNDIQITNISNYYYNLLTGAIDRLCQPWYIEIMGEARDMEGVLAANEIIRTDVDKTLTFAVTDVSGDTRFHAWVEGEDGKTFSVSSSAEGTETTEGGILFTGPSYLSVKASEAGKGTLYVEPVSDVAVFSARANRYSFPIEAVAAHRCGSEEWVALVTSYDDQDGYEAKYCDVCKNLLEVRTASATDACASGGYRIVDEIITDEEYQCKLVFDAEIPARSGMAILVLEDTNGVMAGIGKDDIKIKPSSTVQVKIPIKNADKFQPRLLLWDNLSKLRPVGTLSE